jgi:protein-S-isoprenylcysteine O-methyltransferase Ste14
VKIAAIIIFALGWIPVFRYRSEHVHSKLAAASRAERRWIPLTIAAVTLHVSLAEILLTTPAVLPQATGRVAGGIAVFLASLLWWVWARRHLGPLDQPLDPAHLPPRLIVSGPFALVRHPLAFGMLLAALGPAIAVASRATWITFAAVALCLTQRCRQDEEGLQQAFGTAYAAYVARTRRLVPFVW